MTPAEVKEIMQKNGYMLKEHKRLANDTGDQLIFTSGEIINVYDKGTFYAQGKNAAIVREILDDVIDPPICRTHPRKVFVVYGHNSMAKIELEAILRRWEIEPLILDQLPSEGQTLIEKLENHTQQAEYAIILATPDDEGHIANKPDEKQFRARQNVVLELGMMLALLGRKRVAILIKDQSSMEKPSDISGLIYIPFKDNVEDGKTLLYKELCSAGFEINPSKL